MKQFHMLKYGQNKQKQELEYMMHQVEKYLQGDYMYYGIEIQDLLELDGIMKVLKVPIPLLQHGNIVMRLFWQRLMRKEI